MSSSHYGKKQSSLLIAAIFYKNDGKTEKIYYDFVSEYLGHNITFYQKCMGIMLEEIQKEVNFKISVIYNITDGGNHFVSRYAYWSIGQFSKHYSIKLKYYH